MTTKPQITPERLGDANKTIITPEWIAERRANIEEVEKRFWHRNLYIINGLKIYDGAKLSFLVEEDLPALTQGFRVALNTIEALWNRNRELVTIEKQHFVDFLSVAKQREEAREELTIQQQIIERLKFVFGKEAVDHEIAKLFE